MDDSIRATLTELFRHQIPLHRHLGLELLEMRDGFIRYRMPFQEEFVGDFRVDRWHGGTLALLMDVAGGSAAMTTFRHADERCATVDLRVDYLRPATDHALIAEGEVIRRGSSLVVTEMKALDDNTGTVFSRGTGVFSVKRVAAEDGE